MKRIFGNFDRFWSLHESASHATLSEFLCQQASSVHQIVGRPMMGYTFCKYPLRQNNEEATSTRL